MNMLWSVIISVVVTFLLGGLWYSEKGFGGIWKRAEGRDVAEKKSHGAKVFVVSIILYILSAIFFGWILSPTAGFWLSVWTGFVVGLFFVAACFGINYAFAGRSWKLLWVDGGYHLVQFVIYGVVFGLFR